MVKVEWVVRVIILKNHDSNKAFPFRGIDDIALFLEQLRYAGLVEIHENGENKIVFDLYPPPKVDSKVWAKQNAARMESFGFNAVSAPKWKSYEAWRVGA